MRDQHELTIIVSGKTDIVISVILHFLFIGMRCKIKREGRIKNKKNIQLYYFYLKNKSRIVLLLLL